MNLINALHEKSYNLSSNDIVLHSKHNNGSIIEGCTNTQFSKCTYKNFTFIINNDT